MWGALILLAPLRRPSKQLDDAVSDKREVDFVGPAADCERFRYDAAGLVQQDWTILVQDGEMVIGTRGVAILHFKCDELHFYDFAIGSFEDINFVDTIVIEGSISVAAMWSDWLVWICLKCAWG